MTTEEVGRTEPTDGELRAWDWHAELMRQERTVPWLARQTKAHYRAIYRYADGTLVAPLDWLRAAAQVLGRAVVS